jgi:hypothetical protein
VATKVDLVLRNATSGELDRVELTVNDPEDCGREVMAALTRERWVLSVGDSIEVQEQASLLHRG